MTEPDRLARRSARTDLHALAPVAAPSTRGVVVPLPVSAPSAAEGDAEGPRSTLRELVEEANQRRRRALHEVDPRADKRHRDRGKRTARERIERLLDPGSFAEIRLFARHEATGFGLEDRRPHGDGVITGWGMVEGRKVFVFAHDARVFGGALGATFARKICALMDLAESTGTPIIGLNDGGGARIQEGISALDGFGEIFRRNVWSSGVIPQISVVLGSCAGGAVYSPALTDFVFMLEDTSSMFITGPDVVRAVTGEDVSQQELGGSAVHSERTGVAAFRAPDEDSLFEEVRSLLSFLPDNNQNLPPEVAPDDDPQRSCEELVDLVPSSERTPYDMRDVISSIVDDSDFLEVHAGWARNIICAFARLDGKVVGVVANQPLVLAGVLDIDASEKAARFVRTCDAFNIPLLTLVDVPGFLPGTEQEHAGVIRRGAKLLYAYCEANVPRIQVIVRKAYGGAYIVMDSKSIGADLSFAWPGNQVAVMGAAGAADIIFRREIVAADNPGRRRDELTAEYAKTVLDPYVAAERGLVDDVINPADTRSTLIRSFAMLANKSDRRPARKHGNIPL
jgi:methylmalonyl-CoA decarboxylase subunit alpha